MKEIFWNGKYYNVSGKHNTIKNLPYPINLLFSAYGEMREMWADTDKYINALNNILAELPYFDSEVIRLRYQSRQSLDKIGVALGVSQHKVHKHECKVINLLNSTECRSLFLEDADDFKPRIPNLSINDLPIRLRHINILKEHGYSSIASVYCDYRNGKLFTIPGLGNRGVDSIKRAFQRLGILW